MMSDKHSPPEAIAILARLKKPRPKDGGDEEMDAADESESSDDDGDGKGSQMRDEGQLSACEDMIAAFRNKDAEALRDALRDFCSYDYEE